MSSKQGDEFYSISEAEAQRAYVSVRRAAQWISFFLPHLQRGFSVLDCGCGVGSITLDIAEWVTPGQVIGVDRDERQLEIARQQAAERGLTNVTFQQGSIYDLPFATESFDAALAHTLLFHLSDTQGALKALWRVLKPGGVVGISDDDYRTAVFSPEHPLMQKCLDLWVRVVQHNGGRPFYSRHLRGELLQAGFARSEGHAVAADHYGTLEETRRFALISSELFNGQALRAVITGQEWATHTELDEIVAYLKAWGERPDAFFGIMYCAAVGWKAETGQPG